VFRHYSSILPQFVRGIGAGLRRADISPCRYNFVGDLTNA